MIFLHLRKELGRHGDPPLEIQETHPFFPKPYLRQHVPTFPLLHGSRTNPTQGLEPEKVQRVYDAEEHEEQQEYEDDEEEEEEYEDGEDDSDDDEEVEYIETVEVEYVDEEEEEEEE